MKSRSQAIADFLEDVLSDGRIENTSKYFHDDVVEEVPLPGQGPGLEGLMDVLRGLRQAFPDMRWSVEEQIEEGDRVVTRFEWTGTHQAEIFGVPPTGRQVTVWGVVIDKFDGDKVKSTRIIMDSLGLMSQLGVFPPPSN